MVRNVLVASLVLGCATISAGAASADTATDDEQAQLSGLGTVDIALDAVPFDVEYGEEVKLRARLTDSSISCNQVIPDCDQPTGTFTFKLNDNVLATVPVTPGNILYEAQAEYVSSTIPAGVYSLSGEYEGNFDNALISVSGGLVVRQRTCTLSLVTTPTSSVLGDPTGANAAVLLSEPRTGRISWFNADTNTLIGQKDIVDAGLVTWTLRFLPVGVTNLRAVFSSGDSNYAGCQSSVASHTVTAPTTATGGVAGPAAAFDQYTLDQGTSVTADVLANDTVGSSPIVGIEILTPPLHGSAVIDGEYNIVYSAPSDFAGLDYLTYRITDDNGLISSVQANFTVKAVDNGGGDTTVPDTGGGGDTTVPVTDDNGSGGGAPTTTTGRGLPSTGSSSGHVPMVAVVFAVLGIALVRVARRRLPA